MDQIWSNCVDQPVWKLSPDINCQHWDGFDRILMGQIIRLHGENRDAVYNMIKSCNYWSKTTSPCVSHWSNGLSSVDALFLSRKSDWKRNGSFLKASMATITEIVQSEFNNRLWWALESDILKCNGSGEGYVRADYSVLVSPVLSLDAGDIWCAAM